MSADFDNSRQYESQSWDGVNRRGEQAEQRSGVKFDATINLGHVLTFVGFVIAGFTAWSTLDKRVTVIEERASLQALVDKNQDATLNASMAQIKESLSDIKGRIDRLAESRR